MTYLAFLVATGLYLAIGSGGPLHNDRWYEALQGRVAALEPDFWLGFVLLGGGAVCRLYFGICHF
jgi:hypothetical protein